MLSNPGIAPSEVIFLQNTPEGTTVTNGNNVDEIKAVVDSGLSVAEAVIPLTRPENIENIGQLNLNF
jgi:hypothetical protein